LFSDSEKGIWRREFGLGFGGEPDVFETGGEGEYSGD
jgi:hypothetical protein